MQRSKAAALLLVATLATLGISAPGIAVPSEAAVEPVPVTAADPSTDATEVLENAEDALDGDTAETPLDAPVESPSLALAELVSVYPELSEREQLEADALLARPDEPGNTVDKRIWTVGAAQPKCGPHVCVHYVKTTLDRATDAWAQATLDVMESVWANEVSSMGYRPPPSDGSKGGSGKFDVYLADIGRSGYYGYCAPEFEVARGRASSYCVLENDFAGFAGTPPDNMKVTAAHEFFHAVQYSYDYAEDKWLMEATATWMEERYADSINDNRQYLKFGQMGKPGTPMDSFGGLTHYGNWPFFERLTDKYGVGAMRNIWNRLDASSGAPDDYSIQAVKKFLSAHGTSLTKFYANFAAGNLAPGRAYSEGSAYNATRFADSFKLTQGRRSIAPHRATLKHLTSKSYRFKPTGSLPGKAKLRITIDGPATSTSPVAVAYIYAKSGKLTKKFIRLNKSGAGSARVKFAPGKISRVTLTLVNASTRFDCWGITNFSCQGNPRDNSSKFSFRATVVR